MSWEKEREHMEHGLINQTETSEKPVHARSAGIPRPDNPSVPFGQTDAETVGEAEEIITVTPVRRTIAMRTLQSVREIPHALTSIETDVTDLVKLRTLLKDDFMRREGVNLTYLAFFIQAVVSAIKDYPLMNSVWAVDKMIRKRNVHISLLIGTEDSVLAPVIKYADQKSVAGIALEIAALTQKARTGRLTLDDMQDGTFTINNTGAFGSILSSPTIHYPQAAILTIESIVKRPRVVDDMIAVRSMANLCLSSDNRILEGRVTGQFLHRVKQNLEAFLPDTQIY
ncbi:2-oxo acid dehydrogenase subunit E2 [Paenibacillus sp. UNC499MF]|uniref:2-oxo acid dehydrogenase subunit E2 n=1 Tax=Paenibacillus sp. UNC499MF TaxID=1502751 RepID=UPI00089F863A|nr:2-oxo acid dehydrogenase subunit E2 [Paenibacillus sp. UNC499MF]SEG66677.1 2-oxoacid dehydrogenases acyltransferase (catalytic domain) [Paenibacillus sp. UNC499MF]